MGFILEDKHGVGIELRRESLYITEPDSDEGKQHLFLYGSTVEVSYDFLNRLLKRIAESEEIQKRLREHEESGIDRSPNEI